MQKITRLTPGGTLWIQHRIAGKTAESAARRQTGRIALPNDPDKAPRSSAAARQSKALRSVPAVQRNKAPRSVRVVRRSKVPRSALAAQRNRVLRSARAVR